MKTAIRSKQFRRGREPRLKPLYALLVPALAMHNLQARAGEAATEFPTVAQVEFDPRFLAQDGRPSVDVSRFEKGNIVSPGNYSIDVYVNENLVTRAEVPFIAVPGVPDAQACFDTKLLKRIGINVAKLSPDVLNKLSVQGVCMPIQQIVKDATAAFDFNEQRLDIGIPQISLVRNARGYVSPELWDRGVNAATLSYNFNLYSYDSKPGGSLTQGYLSVNGGVNIGDWHFRHNGAFTFDSNGGRNYQDIATYVQRDLPSLSSQLTLGEAFTSGELFDSTGFRGVLLSTDDRMLPDSMRGYAPVIRGVATTNAKVTVRQNGITIYQTTVAPGAFEINDLYATGYGGDLDVQVQEADGSIHSFSVPYSAVPLSLRPGVNRYAFVAGAVRDPFISSNPLFAQATWQHGFTNLFTGYGGVTAAPGYAAGMIGGAFNTAVGALGADVTQAFTNLPGQGRFSGQSVRLSFAKGITATGTNIAIAAYRYSTSGYYSLNDAMEARYLDQGSPYSSVLLRQRQRATVTLNQRLGDRWGQLNLTGSTVNYWNRSGSDINYSFGYNNTYRNIGYSLSINRQRNAQGTQETLYYASITIPLGKVHPVTVTGNVAYGSDRSVQAQTTLSGSAGVDNSFSYGLTANHASGGGSSSTTSGGANAAYRSPFAQYTTSFSVGNAYTQGSVGMSGGVVAYPGGISLSQPLSDTIGIVEAPDAAGARLLNSAGARVDGGGHAIVPYLTPYSLNTVELDPKGLSTDVELQMTSQDVAPYAGSVVLLKYPTVSGRAAVIEAHRSDGQPLPFGASVVDESGKEVGVVGQASRIFVRGVKDSGELTVQWDEASSASCHIAYTLPPREKGTQPVGYQKIDSTCVSFAPNDLLGKTTGASSAGASGGKVDASPTGQ